jgi:hypothetical protein
LADRVEHLLAVSDHVLRGSRLFSQQRFGPCLIYTVDLAVD